MTVVGTSPVRAVSLVLALPLLLANVLLWIIAVGERTGSSPSMETSLPSLAQAAALGQGAVIMRQVASGHSPEQLHEVSDGVASAPLVLTANEAAVWARRLETVVLLDRLGGIVGTRPFLACLARDVGAPEIASYLSTTEPCVPGRARMTILARRRGQ